DPERWRPVLSGFKDGSKARWFKRSHACCSVANGADAAENLESRGGRGTENNESHEIFVPTQRLNQMPKAYEQPENVSAKARFCNGGHRSGPNLKSGVAVNYLVQENTEESIAADWVAELNNATVTAFELQHLEVPKREFILEPFFKVADFGIISAQRGVG